MLSSDSNNNLPDPVVYTGKHKNQQNSKHHNNTKDLSLKNNKNSVSANGIINHHDVTTTWSSASTLIALASTEINLLKKRSIKKEVFFDVLSHNHLCA